jgi:hypothetical protein
MIMRRFAMVLAAIGVAALVALARPAEAATFITVTATGTITDSSEAGLIGREAVMTQRFTVTPGSLFPDPAFGVGVFDMLSLSITLDGTPYFFDTSGGAGALGIYTLGKLDLGGGTPASISAQTTIEVAPGVALFAQAAISSLVDDFVDPIDLLQDFAFPPGPAGGEGGFGASAEDATGTVLGYFLAERLGSFVVTVDRDIVVPAPAGFAMFAAGCLGLVLVRRRRA